MNTSKDLKRGQVHLTLDVTYALRDGDSLETMRDLLEHNAKSAVSDGLLLRGSELTEVETFSLEVSVATGPRKVFVASYEHRHGMDQRVFATEEKAEAWKNALGAEYWEEELSDRPLPADASMIGSEYFDAMSDSGRPEYFRVEALEVETA